ncbi:MAG TPA: class I SAM-dependent methyltransferase [Thermoanaerobaculia bacterium]|nr:class I SAM-dependent methyltransferase [Thermoanaerobaculia bacterium]
MSDRDPYSRVDYRRLIAWPQRIEREAPFLASVLGAPPGRVFDLGCGTGEHARFLADRGFEVVAIDASESMIQKATEEPLPEGLSFVLGDLGGVGDLAEGSFDGAICLGNTLPHVREPGQLERALLGLRQRLRPGAPVCLQLLNYEGFHKRGERALPVNIRPGEQAGEEVVFLRLMTEQEAGTWCFNPTTLRYRPGSEPPLEVVSSKNVLLRGWLLSDLRPRLEGAGFGRLELFGGMEFQPFDAATSADLVIVAR